MAWILDEYSKFHGYSPAIVTGKPLVSIYDIKLEHVITILDYLDCYSISLITRILVDHWEERLQRVVVLFMPQRRYLANMGTQSVV